MKQEAKVAARAIVLEVLAAMPEPPTAEEIRDLCDRLDLPEICEGELTAEKLTRVSPTAWHISQALREAREIIADVDDVEDLAAYMNAEIIPALEFLEAHRERITERIQKAPERPRTGESAEGAQETE